MNTASPVSLVPPPAGLSPALIPAFPPAWAEVFGEDDFGIFAEFSLEQVNFVWRWIPPGRFLMGSPETETGRFDNEGPQHSATLTRGFWLGETPVTQAQWRILSPAQPNPSHFQGEDRPVEQVSWPDARGLAQRLKERIPGLFATLPTEAQWEYACRAGTESAFHDGSPCTKPEGLDPALDLLGWFDDNSKSSTQAVKLKRPNSWGLYDMHGNVWEWCADAWQGDVYRTRQGGVSDPETTAANEDAFRVVRGGSWGDRARLARSAYRIRSEPGIRWYYLGLRLAAGQEPVPAEPQAAARPSDRKGGSRG